MTLVERTKGDSMTNQPERLMVFLPDGWETAPELRDECVTKMGATRVGPWVKIAGDDPDLGHLDLIRDDGEYWYCMAIRNQAA